MQSIYFDDGRKIMGETGIKPIVIEEYDLAKKYNVKSNSVCSRARGSF